MKRSTLVLSLLLMMGMLISSCSKVGDIIEEIIDEPEEEETKDSVPTTVPNTTINFDVKDSTYFIHQEIDLTSILTVNNGYQISKVELSDYGVKTEVPDPVHYVADKWGEFSLVYTISKLGFPDEEVIVPDFKVLPLEWTVFQVPEADNAKHNYNFNGNEATDMYNEDCKFAASVGLFDLQSIILEAIANGTTTLTAAEVKSSLARNHILWLYEAPQPGMDEYDLFESLPTEFDDDISVHAYKVAKIFLMGTKDVISKLDTKVLYSQDGLLYDDWNEVISYVQNHPDWIFFTVNTHTYMWEFGEGTYEDFVKQQEGNKDILDHYRTFFGSLDNIYFACSAMGNLHSSIITLNNVLTSEDIKNGMHGWWGAEWECGADGILGSSRYNCAAIANGKTAVDIFGGNEFSLYPTKENLNKENVWVEHHYASTSSAFSQATSYSAPASCGKAYLLTCAQMLVNPNVTRAEARKFVRDTALDGKVTLYDKNDNGKITTEFYGNAKVMNPLGAIPLFQSTVPSTILLAAEPISIQHGLHRNSVVVGPGVVDAEGNEVTADNYPQMLGKQLYIDPAKVYDYGHSVGDKIEYVEYLCVDGRGSGAMDRSTEAYKSFVSKTFTVTLY